eukprot:scaffold12537_cov72-Phaeocystis_antarctica.AAC.2
MSWLFDLLRAPGDLLRVTSVPPPPPEPRLGMLFGTAVVLCSGVLATACLRKRFLRALFRSIFSPGDAAARDAAALIKSLSQIDIDADDDGDRSANPALQELQRTEEDYVEDLRALAHAKAGLVSGGLLSEAKAELLFSNAPVLLTLNQEFLSKLNSSDSSPAARSNCTLPVCHSLLAGQPGNARLRAAPRILEVRLNRSDPS